MSSHVCLTTTCETLLLPRSWCQNNPDDFRLASPELTQSLLFTQVLGADSGVLKSLRQRRFPLLHTQSADSPQASEGALVMSTAFETLPVWTCTPACVCSCDALHNRPHAHQLHHNPDLVFMTVWKDKCGNVVTDGELKKKKRLLKRPTS